MPFAHGDIRRSGRVVEIGFSHCRRKAIEARNIRTRAPRSSESIVAKGQRTTPFGFAAWIEIDLIALQRNLHIFMEFLFSIFDRLCHSSIGTTTKSNFRRQVMEEFRDILQIVEGLKKNNPTKRYLIEMMVISLLATLTGRSSYESFEQFAQANFESLRGFMRLQGGPPNQYDFSALFDALDPKQFESVMASFAMHLLEAFSEGQIAVDGEALESGFAEISQRSPLNLVQAFLPGVGLAFGQVKADGKSSEATALPSLLDILNLEGRTAIVYALHNLRDLSAQIVEKGGAYVIPVKSDQRPLYEDVQLWFDNPEALKEMLSFQSNDRGHGRNETFKAMVSHDVGWLQGRHDWPGLKAVGMTESAHEQKGRAEQRSVDHFIMSREITPERLKDLTLRPQGTKNRFRWVLDVVLDEDR